MLGINYVGQSLEELNREIVEVATKYPDFNPVIFIEPCMEQYFVKDIGVDNYFDLKSQGSLVSPVRVGFCAKYRGYGITNAKQEYFKRQIKEVTFSEVAEKFEVDVKNLRIKTN